MDLDFFDAKVNIDGEELHVGGFFDYVDAEPDYTIEDRWWHIDSEGAIHVQVYSKYRERCEQLLNKEKLTDEELIELGNFQLRLNTITQRAAERSIHSDQASLVALYRIVTKNLSSKKNRTEKKAGNVADIPKQLVTIVDPQFSNSTSLYQKGKAYLQPLTTGAQGLTYQNNTLFFEGIPASVATLKDYFSDSVPADLDLSFLQLCFSIILTNFTETMEESNTVDQIISIYYPNVARVIGKSQNISRTDVEFFINKILSYQSIMGIIDKEIQPVLIYAGEDRSRNIIYLSSPYLIKIIRTLFNVNVRRNKHGELMLNNDGTPKLKQAYSYLINSSIAKERNKKAVENVIIITTLIEQKGDRILHITAKEIIERNPQLKQGLEGKSTAQINVVLKRAFQKTWELLDTQTKLKEQYEDICLPDPCDAKNIPTKSTLNMVFSFPHNGKKKDITFGEVL